MSTRGQQGFTIIETTLFLAITGLLIMMMVAGTGAALNIQRYRDATESFKSLVQQQYADLSNVQNGRTNNWTCDATSTVIEDGSNDKTRGQSNCFLVGKYMRIEDGAISTYAVLASRNGSIPLNDIQSMVQNYVMNVSTSEVEERTMEWGTQIAWATAGTVDMRSVTTPRSIGILFIRSPDSGQIYTFSSDSVPSKDSIGPSTFTDMLIGGATVPGQAARMVCIESGGLFVDGSIGLYIAPYAASASSIETRSNDYSKSLQGEGASQC